MGYTNVRGVPGWQRRDPSPAAAIIDGKAIAAAVRAEVARDVAAFTARAGRAPGLATILIGEDPASAIYVANKRKAAGEVGIRSFHHSLPSDVSSQEVEALIAALNDDDQVAGVLCQLPVPPPLDGNHLTGLIDPLKDVDGLHMTNAGALSSGRAGLRPCTPGGVMRLLQEAAVELRGAEAVVLGRSNLFGKPMAQLLLVADATVTTAHRWTRALPDVCRRADVLVVAVGQDRMVKADWIKPGATVIDVGINRAEDGLHGDVDFERARRVAGAITPVPGGVGPMTIAMLLKNTVAAAELQG